MRFVGIDLAWSLRNTDRPETGAVALDSDGVVVGCANLGTDDAILEFVLANTDDEGCVVSVDAPLVVPNPTGQRACERALQSAGIAAYPANRELFDRTLGGVRGEVIADRLRAHGFELRTQLEQQRPTRAVLEVYPRATIRRLWGAVPPYKGAKIKAGVISAGIASLQARLISDLDPPIKWDVPPHSPETVSPGSGAGLKRAGDLLDAALSAWVGFAAWRSPEGFESYGTVEDGFIVVARSRQTQSASNAATSGHSSTKTGSRMADAAPPLQPQEHLNDASHEAGLHRYIEMWNTGDISVLEGLVAPTYVGYFAAGRRNRDELSSLIAARGLDPPGVVFTIEDCVAVGDRTAARLSATRADATPAGDFGLHLARWTGGRIVEEWWSWSDGSSGELGGNTD